MSEMSEIILVFGILLAVAITPFVHYYLVLAHRKFQKGNIFVRWLTAQQLEQLSRSSIPFTSTSLEPGDDGVVFSAKHFRLVKRILRAQVIDTIPVRSDPQIHEVVLAFEPSADTGSHGFKTVVAHHRRWSNPYEWWQCRKLTRLVDRVLMPLVKKNIVIHRFIRNSTAPITDGQFHLHLCATPGSRKEHCAVPEILLGVFFGQDARAYPPSGQGVPIMAPKSNFAIGELVDDNLYLHLNVFTPGRFQVGLLFRFLQLAGEELDADHILETIIGAVKNQDTPAHEPFVVDSTGLSGRKLKVMAALVQEILAPVVRSNVTIHECDGRIAQPIEDGNFHIFLYSSATGFPCLDSPETILGFRLLRTEKPFAPSGFGASVVDDNGFIIGEVIGRNLFLHMHIMHFGSKSEAALLARLLTHVCDCGVIDSDEETITHMVRQQFVSECLRQFALNSGSDASAGETARAQSGFHDQLHALLHEELNLFQLKAAPEEEIGREFDELTNFPNVVALDVDGSKIIVTTDNLYCVHPQTHVKYDIGAFKIHINTGSNTVQWFNQTRRVDGGHHRMNAPHVNGDGNACLGNTAEVFPQLIKKRELTSVVQLAIAFVESVNVKDTWGKHIGAWPKAS
jgi:hypothetical protein